MSNRIKLKLVDVKRAFQKEAGTLQNGEISRFLPGFTGLEIVSEYGRHVPDVWNDYYVAYRVRDKKTYVFTYRNDHYTNGPFYQYTLDPTATIEFVEMEKKTYTITYYEQV